MVNLERGRERIESAPPESEKFKSRIFLAFFRHSEKGEKPFELLTPAGRKLAKEKAKEWHPEEIPLDNIKQAVAFGSPRIRAKETAGFVLGGGREEITGEESLEELERKLNQGLKLGSKIGTDKRLDFYYDLETPLGKAQSEAFKRGELLKFIVEESDKLARDCQDEKSMTYSRAAAGVAEIVKKYVGIEKYWDKLARDKSKGYPPTLERYLGSHAGVTESFLAKVIEKTKGIEERNKFVQALGNQSFDYVEGFKAEIINPGRGGDPENPEIIITYQKKDKEGKIIFDFKEKIDKKLINEIIQEGK